MGVTREHPCKPLGNIVRQILEDKLRIRGKTQMLEWRYSAGICGAGCAEICWIARDTEHRVLPGNTLPICKDKKKSPQKELFLSSQTGLFSDIPAYSAAFLVVCEPCLGGFHESIIPVSVFLCISYTFASSCRYWHPPMVADRRCVFSRPPHRSRHIHSLYLPGGHFYIPHRTS